MKVSDLVGKNELSLMVVGGSYDSFQKLEMAFYQAKNEGGGIFSKYIDHHHAGKSSDTTENIPECLPCWRKQKWGGSDLIVVDVECGDPERHRIEGSIFFATAYCDEKDSVPYKGFEALAKATNTVISIFNYGTGSTIVVGNTVEMTEADMWYKRKRVFGR